jgi:hypothetical protein
MMNACLVVESNGTPVRLGPGERKWSKALLSLSGEQMTALVARISGWQQRVAVKVKA